MGTRSSREPRRMSISDLAKRWSSGKAEKKQRKTLGLLNYLMPFYLCPVLYPGTKESKCFYCVLLMMSWWQLHAMPKPVLAFLPAIALPLFGIMGHEEVAANYLSMDVLTALLLLWLVVVSDEMPTIGRLSYVLVSRFGSRAGPVLVLLTALTFVASLVLPQSLVAVFVMCLVERLCNFVREEGLQDTQRCLDRAVADDTVGNPCDVDTLMLYEELAVALWKRHKAGLDDHDSVECWNIDRRGNGRTEPKVQRTGGLKQRKISILKSSKSAATQEGAEACTPSGTRFADVPPNKVSAPADEAKPSDGKLIRAKRRRQSFADKARVFEYNDDRRVTHDMPPRVASLQEESNSSRTSNASPRFTPSQQSAGSDRASFARTPSLTTAEASGGAAPGSKCFGCRPTVSLASTPNMSGVAFAKTTSTPELATQGFRPATPTQRRVSMAAAVGPHREESAFPGAGGRLQARRRISIRYPHQALLAGHRSFMRFRSDDRSTASNAMSSLNGPDKEEEEDPDEQRLRRNQEVLAALCVCGSMTSVAASIASYWFTPAAEAIAANLDSSLLSFWSWTLITLPVSLAASALSSVCVYYGNLHAHENQLSEDAEDLIRCYAKLKLCRMERCAFFERLIMMFCIGYSGITVWFRFIHRQDLNTSILGVIVLLASTALSWRPGTRPSRVSPREFQTNVDVDGDDTPDFRGSGSDRGLNTLTSRLPWGVIVIYGAASVITRVAQTAGVAKVAFDTSFWSQQSDLVKQVVLTIASSLMAEFMNATALCDTILPMVVSLSTDTQHDALYFGLPVAVGASMNTIMPVSLPLVMLHDMAPVTRKQLILTGAFVKTVVVASILVSMNTTGEYVLNSSRQMNNTESL